MAKKESDTLEGMGAWGDAEYEDDMNIINGTWAFKFKQFPNGTVKKFKACICVCGDQQLDGIDCFETYTPVVQWTTNCLMLILENLLGLIFKQADVTAAFLHATLGENERVYLETSVSSSADQMESSKSFASKKLSMVCVKVLAPCPLSQENSSWFVPKPLCFLEISH